MEVFISQIQRFENSPIILHPFPVWSKGQYVGRMFTGLTLFLGEVRRCALAHWRLSAGVLPSFKAFFMFVQSRQEDEARDRHRLVTRKSLHTNKTDQSGIRVNSLPCVHNSVSSSRLTFFYTHLSCDKSAVFKCPL